MEAPPPSFFTQHNVMEKEAAEFAGKILNAIILKLPYGSITYNSATKRYSPDPMPLDFKYLGFLSSYIRLREAHKEHSFYNKTYAYFHVAFEAATRLDLSNVSNIVLTENARKGIVEFIWRMHDCIKFVKSYDENPRDFEAVLGELRGDTVHLDIRGELLALNPLREGMSVRPETEARSWQNCVRLWERNVERWTRFLDLYNSVFPCIFWDIPGTLTLLATNFPKIFWIEFWKILAEQAGESFFKTYLVSKLAPSLINNQRGRSTTQAPHKIYCTQGLQNIMDDIERKSVHAENFRVRLAHFLTRPMINEALIETDIVVYPREDALGPETRLGLPARAQDSRKRRQGPSVFFPR